MEHICTTKSRPPAILSAKIGVIGGVGHIGRFGGLARGGCCAQAHHSRGITRSETLDIWIYSQDTPNEMTRGGKTGSSPKIEMHCRKVGRFTAGEVVGGVTASAR